MEKLNFEKVREFISNVFNDNVKKIVIMNFNDKKHIKEIIDYYKNININISNLSDKCNEDYLLNVYSFVNYIQSIHNNSIIYGFSTHFKLQGKETLNRIITDLAEDRVYQINGKIIFVVYDFETQLEYLIRKNQRVINNIVFVNDRYIENRLFFSKQKILNTSFVEIAGLNNIGEFEVIDNDCVCVSNNIDTLNDDFSLIKYEIYKQDIYKEFYDKFAIKVDKRFNQEEILTSIIKSYSKNELDIFKKDIIENINTDNIINLLLEYDGVQSYLFLIIVKEYFNLQNKNTYLGLALKDVFCTTSVVDNIYCYIKNIDIKEDSFAKYYNERYKIFKKVDTEYLDSISFNYYNSLIDKDKNLIYYLSDLTILEKEKLIDCICKNCIDEIDKNLLNVLKNNYYELYYYLTIDKEYIVSGIEKDFINKYLKLYKEQKVINKTNEGFISMVDNISMKYDMIRNIDPRKTILLSLNIDKERDIIVFYDALGIEFINYILCLSEDKQIYSKAYIGRASLPTETKYNKDFLDFANNYTKYSDIDKIVHEESQDSMDTKTKKPYYIIKQLDSIKKSINQIKKNYLSSGKYKNVYIVADHGATRIPKIFDNKKTYEGEFIGESGGRYTKYEESLKDIKAICRVEQDGIEYAVLSNYDRFKGGRLIGNEVHGGATLEETLVPIIKLSLSKDDAKIKLTTERTVKIRNNKKFDIVVYADNKINDSSFKLITNKSAYEPNTVSIENTNDFYKYILHFNEFKYSETGTFDLQVYEKSKIIDSIQIIFTRAGITKNEDEDF